MPKLFISYRRTDSAEQGRVLRDVLAQAFGPEQVFLDVESSPLGLAFVPAITRVIRAADAVIVLIGPNFATAVDDEGTRRLTQRHDYVRVELELALFRNRHQHTPVIPVTFGGVRLSTLELPDDLQPLKKLSGFELGGSFAPEDLAPLVRRLAEIPAIEEEPFPSPETLNQGIEFDRSLSLFAGRFDKVPLDTEVLLWQDGDHWSIAVECPSDPSYSRRRGVLYTDWLRGLSDLQAVGAVMEGYGIPSSQVHIFWPAPTVSTPLSWLGLAPPKKLREDGWRTVFPRAAYSDLGQLLREFDSFVGRAQLGMVDTIPAEGSPIGNYALFGNASTGIHPETGEKTLLFGRYLFSVTTHLGGVGLQDHQLWYLPTVPGTQLRSFSARLPPYQIDDITFIGHVAVGDEGFHIVYV